MACKGTRPNPWFAAALLALSAGCASSATTGEGLEPRAPAFSQGPMRVERPDQWQFVAPDDSVAADTVIILQGPVGDHLLAPVIEISRRPLTAADRRRRPVHLLTSLMTETVQYFAGFEVKGEPQPLEVGGKPGAQVRMRLTEMLEDGQTVARRAQFYGVVTGGDMWLIRCIGPADGSVSGVFSQVIESLSFS